VSGGNLLDPPWEGPLPLPWWIEKFGNLGEKVSTFSPKFQIFDFEKAYFCR